MAAGPITNEQLFLGAQALFPDLFPATPAPQTIENLPFQGKVFLVKAYGNGNFLAISSDGFVWGLGAYTGGVPLQFSTVQSYADLVCSRINCGGNGGGGTGSANECTMPASQALQVGFRFRGVYNSATFGTQPTSGEYTIESQIVGQATFEGQSAFKLSSTISGLQLGVEYQNTTFTYHQPDASGLVKTLGMETEQSVPPFTQRISVVYTPPDVDTEFSLPLGGTLTKSVTSRTTTTMSGGGVTLPPQTTTDTATQTHAYEARESITVPAGTYDTCRYRETEPSGGYTLQWHVVGKGIPARIEGYSASGVVGGRSELKSATLNGAPL